MAKFQRIVLASRPTGQVQPDSFRLETVEVPELSDGEVLVRNDYLSLDPYMRGRMSESKSYAPPAALDETMVGGTAGEVVASKNPSFAVGDKVVGMLGWAEMGVSDGSTLRKVDTSQIALQAYLGVTGMPGMTAWYGVHQILAPKSGETVVVSAASGAVGSVAGQLARLKGCRVVGIAGGKEKCTYVVKELGFDACVDYKAGHLAADLAAATPAGVDAVFENVGGEILDATLARMNAFGRIAVCGLIAGYNGEDVPIYNFGSILTNRLTVRGYIVSEHMEFWAQGLAELAGLVAGGKLKYRETVAQGLANAPEALIGLLKGKNFGKQLVKLT
jgi:NADPH-dependent curcumin reductase CurA